MSHTSFSPWRGKENTDASDLWEKIQKQNKIIWPTVKLRCQQKPIPFAHFHNTQEWISSKTAEAVRQRNQNPVGISRIHVTFSRRRQVCCVADLKKKIHQTRWVSENESPLAILLYYCAGCSSWTKTFFLVYSPSGVQPSQKPENRLYSWNYSSHQRRTTC